MHLYNNNIQFLKEYFPETYHQVLNYKPSSSIKIEEAKRGGKTLSIKKGKKEYYIHSRYSPIKEAETIIDQYDDIEHYEYILFYGLGLGYHVKAMAKRYPNKSLILYEPRSEIFVKALKELELHQFPSEILEDIYIEINDASRTKFTIELGKKINYGNILIIVLPSYKNLFADQYNEFIQDFYTVIQLKKFNVHTNFAFQKLWTINAMKNFRQILSSTSILLNKEKFCSKPAIIVSAGPSLNEEIEHIRHIKENDLAYVFSVGSAINTLIHNNIHPHACCTMDPKKLNQIVFQILYDNDIDTIPMIFGSTVGYETVSQYKGPKSHMLMSQDTVAQYYLRTEDNQPLEIINDAPTVAVATLQLLYKLGCDPIIFVGQNLAYKDKKEYSGAIKHVAQEITEEKLRDAFIVKDVYGKDIYTTQGYNRMRMSMEKYIEAYRGVEFINTTKGGAHIEGTKFIDLESLKKRLTKRVVEENWYKTEKTQYDLNALKQQSKLMIGEYEKYKQLIMKAKSYIDEINDSNHERKSFDQLKSIYKEIKENNFHKIFIKPMNRVQEELYDTEIQDIKEEEYNKHIVVYKKFIKLTINTFEIIDDIFDIFNLEIEEHIKDYL